MLSWLMKSFASWLKHGTVFLSQLITDFYNEYHALNTKAYLGLKGHTFESEQI
jgi:hypothetical protein